MAYSVVVMAGLVDVVLPNQNRYQGGDVVILTDEQYGLIPLSTRAAVLASAAVVGDDMAYTVTIQAGLVDVVLPNGGRYQGGDVVVLTAGQYGEIPLSTRTAVLASATIIGAAGGGSVSVETYLTLENVVLANTLGLWKIVKTSASVPLQAQIAASVGSKVTIFPSFMRSSASQFLDWALLDSSGVPNIYASTGTGTPASEGNPAYYPQNSSFPGTPSAWQFTVGAGHISGGNVTVALVTKGAGGGTVYASATYPMSILLTSGS